MKSKKKYRKELLKVLQNLDDTQHYALEKMTNLMLMKELKKNKISFEKGDVFSFDDDIFDYSKDKNIRRLAKLRKKMLKTMYKIVEDNKFKDKEIAFLA